ncbi:MAG: hypothetical protein AB1486_30665, partial [Planctomycetota bacterium]
MADYLPRHIKKESPLLFPRAALDHVVDRQVPAGYRSNRSRSEGAWPWADGTHIFIRPGANLLQRGQSWNVGSTPLRIALAQEVWSLRSQSRLAGNFLGITEKAERLVPLPIHD